LTELKSLPKPPAGVDMVTAACLILLEHEYKNHKWDRAKKMMANVDQFKASLQNFKYEPYHTIRTLEDWGQRLGLA
jgi:dynein heavy chain